MKITTNDVWSQSAYSVCEYLAKISHSQTISLHIHERNITLGWYIRNNWEFDLESM